MEIKNLQKILARVRIVPDLTGLLPEGAEFFLVGGALRDFLLGRPMNDFDFASPFDPTPLARSFAGQVGGHWFPLDIERRQSRVVARPEGEPITYDFAPYRGPGLEADLRLRDFTVNALVLPLPHGEDLFDPLGGLDDLRARRLRGCSADVFLDDPLRVLKGVRHAAVQEFAIEEETAARMRSASGLLGRVAPERTRSEIGMIFATKPIVSAISLMHSFSLLAAVFGPPGAAGSEAAGSFLAGRMEEVLAAAGREGMAGLLTTEFESGLSRTALLQLAAFLRGWRPADLDLALGHLRLGRRAAALVHHLLELPAGKGCEADRLPLRERSRALWAAEIGGSIPDTLLFLALLRPEPPEAAFAALHPVLRDWLGVVRDGRVPDLVDGRWVQERFGIAEGPELGKALADLRREEIAGRIADPEGARAFLRRRQEKD